MEEEKEAEKVGLTSGRWAKAQFGQLIMNTLISCLFTWMIFNGKRINKYYILFIRQRTAPLINYKCLVFINGIFIFPACQEFGDRKIQGGFPFPLIQTRTRHSI